MPLPLSGPAACYQRQLLPWETSGASWQWNHNPIPSRWSFTARPGWLRLTTGHVAAGLTDARILTQRTLEPLRLPGDTDSSGLRIMPDCALQGRYGQIGIAVETGRKTCCICKLQTAAFWNSETDRRGGCWLQ
ncbi:MAG: hypothetical protein ACLUOI_17365 [Eisenbergiella sp.]